MLGSRESFARLMSETTVSASGVPLRFPPILTTGILETGIASQELWTGLTTQTYVLNGSFLGPTIKIHRNDTLNVRLLNRLTEDAILHWHGIIAPAPMDGHPKYGIKPNAEYAYSFPIVQRAGTYFYHSHTFGLTAKQVYMGLAGFFIVTDDVEAALQLPSGKYDIPLAIQDKRVDANKQLVYSPSMMDIMNGYLGDTVLVNGTPNPYLNVGSTMYRFRLLNAANARIFNIGFSDDRTFSVIGSDGGLLTHPVESRSVVLSPGERCDILVDFGGDAIGSSVSLRSTATSTQGSAFQLLRIDITERGPGSMPVPAVLSAIPTFDPTQAKTKRQFLLEQNMMTASGMHTINGVKFQLDRVDVRVPFDTLELWEFKNVTNEFHPMHVHGAAFQILDRNGNTTLRPPDLGWKDTVLVNPNETVRILIRFTDYAGLYLLHCHNLEHEDDGMMLNLEVMGGPTAVQPGGGTEPNDAIRVISTRERGTLQLEYSASLEERSLEVFDILGRKVTAERISGGQILSRLNVSTWRNGEYFCRLGMAVAKVVVVK